MLILLHTVQSPQSELSTPLGRFSSDSSVAMVPITLCFALNVVRVTI